MTRQFTIQTAIRMIPSNLQQALVGLLDFPVEGIRWAEVKRNNVGPVLTVLRELSSEQSDCVEDLYRQVFDLASDRGIQALTESCNYSGNSKMISQLPDGNVYAKAAWARIHYPEVFHTARRIDEVEQMAWWRKRDDLPVRAPRTDCESISSLAKQVSDLLLTEQGRGQQCTVEIFNRGAVHYYFGFPDDYLNSVITHDTEGKLSSSPMRQTFQIVWAYHETEGSLEVYARVPPRIREQIEAMFAKTILEHELIPWPPEAAYQLDHLLNPQNALTTDPLDCVSARIRRVCLQIPNSRQRIALEAEPTGEPEEIYKMIDNLLNHDSVPISALRVVKVGITMKFQGEKWEKPSSMTFDVSMPNTCNLRNRKTRHADLARKYLIRWGIAHGKCSEVSAQSA